MSEIKINADKQKWFTIFILAVALIVVYKTLDNIDFIFAWIGKLFSVLAPFIAAFAIAYIINIPCKKIEALIQKSKRDFFKKRARVLSVLSVYVILLAIVVVFLSYMIPAIARSAVELITNLPGYLDNAVSYINSRFNVNEVLEEFRVQDVLGWINLTDVNSYTRGILGFTSGIFTVILAIIASVYMLLDKEHLLGLLNRAVSALTKERVERKIVIYASRVNDIFSKFLYAQLLDAAIIGILSTIILSIMGVRYAPLLGLLLGVFNMIPYFGSIFASALAALVSLFTGGLAQAIWVGAVLLALQQIDGNIIGPRLIGDSLNIRPLGIIIAIAVGGGLFGILGMFLAVPTFAIIKTIIVEYIEVFEGKKEDGDDPVCGVGKDKFVEE